MKTSRFKAGVTVVAIAATLTLSGCVLSSDQPEDVPASAEPTEAVSNDGVEGASTESVAATDKPVQETVEPEAPKELAVQPPASEVVPDDAKAAATTLTDAPLPVVVQPYSGDELFAAGGGGCGMSLWRAEGSYQDSSVLFSGFGEGPQLLMKLDGKFVAFERIEGSGKEFYGQFAQQRFRDLAGNIEVTTDVELGAEGEIESVAIDKGRVVITQDEVSQEIAVKGDAGC